MERDFKFAVDEIQKINLEDYDNDEFAIAHMGFLSDKPNSHELKISAEVLKEYAKTVLGKWVIADMTSVIDSGTHTSNQKIVGRIPENQDVEFVVDEDGYTRAYVDVVISKLYAKDYCAIFENDNKRSVSVEMRVCCSENDEDLVESFNIAAVSTLGHNYRPSCPDSDIVFTRFSEDEADNFFAKVQNNRLTALERFAEERKQSMAEKKSYKVDKSKEAMSTKEWGSVDKTALRNKIMESSNRDKLVKDVYMLAEDGWQDAPSEKLKYPVMCFEGDKLVYNEGGLPSALGYAKKENETSVITKVEKIRKKLGLDDNTEGKEETAKMSKEIEFAAVDIGDMWNKVFDALHAKYPDDDWGSVYRIEGIYEEDNKKFAVICRKDEDTKYRLDFSLTEDGLKLAEEIVKVELEIVETDEVRKFAEPENVEKYRQFSEDVNDEDDDDCDPEDKAEGDDDCKDGEEKKMSVDEMEAEIARLKKDVEDRDNIIMEKDTELAELRTFKKGVEDKEKAMSVESVMEEIKGFVDEVKFKEFREEGLACEMAEIDGWKNKVKAFCFEAKIKNPKKKEPTIFSFAMDVNNYKNTTNSLWD